ncbi:folylpolyglutamate synthase/dihydrofolate synthase family protein [Sneathiella sp.]|uniref:bifunctional folylpolyglutamate synthase/dihydrofolate synthase n=1 Tax=Sneathiella sp. TaxID=1964365 RepID=UPI00356A1098
MTANPRLLNSRSGNMTADTSDQVLTRLMTLHPKIIDLSLARMEQVLAKLDHPEKRLPPVLHVAGTNGKGSLIAHLRAMLEAAGYRVHVYTSPHLVRFAERIRVAGTIIDEKDLAELLAFCEQANGPTPITYFEITTAAAFKAFAETPADILLLETGLGGRLDATNMVERPILTAITPISMDHAEYLGNELAGIAGEKAGIMKAGVPVVIGRQTSEALAVLRATAARLKAATYIFDEDWSCRGTGDGWRFRGRTGEQAFPMSSLAGMHQIDNAATAVACLEQLRAFNVTPDHIAEGLRRVEWPARLQRLTTGKLASLLPANVEIWLDGGHNPAAAEQIAKSFRDWNRRDPKPTYLITGMLNTKDRGAFFRELAETITKGCCIAIAGEAATTPADELAKFAIDAGLDVSGQTSLGAAVMALMPDLEQGGCRLLIAGSLYLAGQVLRENG